ncbi:hypothetical protein BVY03_04400 [bacterium K02(2017)]|nr:hypothetical protein BVY03_04400 [bacterium K02(2017)]
MKSINTFLSIILLFCLIFIFNQCGAGSISALSDSGPLSLPPTIAKAQKGIDAKSMQFTDSFSTSNLRYAIPSVDASNTIGTISGRLNGATSGTIGIYSDGSLITTVESTDGTFSYSLTGDLTGQQLCYVVFEDVTTSSAASPCVDITLSYNSLSQKFVTNSFITNYSTSSTESDTAIDIESNTIAISPNELIGFIGSSTVDNTLQYSISSIPTAGGANSILKSGLLYNLQQILYDGTNNLYGIDSASGVVYSVLTNGTVETVENTETKPDTPKIDINLMQDFLGVSFYASNVSPQTQTVLLTDIGTEEFGQNNIELPVPTTETKVVTELDFAFSNAIHIVMIKKFEDDTYEMAEYNIGQIMQGDSTVMPAPTYSFTSTDFIGDPVTDWGFNKGRVVYRCQNGNYVNLCGYDRIDGALGVLVSGDFNVLNSHIDFSGSYASMELQVTADGTTTSQIAIYEFDSGNTFYPGPGKFPRSIAANLNERWVAYYGLDKNNKSQVGVYNLENIGLLPIATVQEIGILPATITIGQSATYSFFTSGGVPPYTYSVVSGGGDIGLRTGYYTAGTSAGTTIIRVTDSADNTSDATITIN